LAPSLERIVAETGHLEQVCKKDLQFGDLVLITTRNSLYSIQVLDRGAYLLSGGWFDRKGVSPATTAIRGCTLGGSTIKMDIVAACGLRLEFDNRVVTTPILKVSLVRLSSWN
jgi:hypothetical protein